MSDTVRNFFGAVVSDLASSVPIPGSGTIGMLASEVFERLTKRRKEQARNLIIGELKAGKATLESIERA